MPKRIGSTPFFEILPQNLARDATTRGVADALDSALIKSVRAMPDLLFFAQLARDSGFEDPVAMLGPMDRLATLSGGLRAMPEPLLDLLAWQLHVEGYETAVNVQAKRELVQMSLLLHRRKGTPWSVKHALQAAFGCPVELSEWYQYGGKPYFFRVAIDTSDAYWGETFSSNAWTLIYAYKNVRSWLEYLETRSTRRLTHHTGLALRGVTTSRSRLWFPVPATPELLIARAAGACAVTTTSLHLHFPGPTISELPVIRTVGASSATTTGLILHFPTPTISELPVAQAVGASAVTTTRLDIHFSAPRNPEIHPQMALGTTSLTSTRVALKRAA